MGGSRARPMRCTPFLWMTRALRGCPRRAAGTVPAYSLIDTLALRERVRETYWKRRDPIIDDRMLWRAQTFRHVMHVLPGQNILEIGCGDGAFTRQLAKVTRGECPLTTVTFDVDAKRPS